MNIRKILYIFLPIISLLTILGIGFSSWAFGPLEIESKNQSIDVKVDNNITNGKLHLIESPDLVVFSEGVGKIEDLTDGIEFYRKNIDTELNEDVYVKDPLLTIDYEILDEEDSIDYLSEFSLFINIDPENSGVNSLKNYIGLTSKYSDAGTTNGFDFKNKITKLNKNEIYPLGGFRLQIDLNETIQYIDLSKKPTTKEKYEELYSKLNTLEKLYIQILFRIS